jgi:hypothetical protein
VGILDLTQPDDNEPIIDLSNRLVIGLSSDSAPYSDIAIEQDEMDRDVRE